MNYATHQAKEMIMAIANLYGHRGYECSIELFEIEEQSRNTKLWLKVKCRKGKGLSRWEEINQEMEECPGIILSDIPGGTCLPYERFDKNGYSHRGYLRVIFSGFQLEALNQEASVRLIAFLSPLVGMTEPDTYNIHSSLLLSESFSTYIAFKLGLDDLFSDYEEDDEYYDYDDLFPDGDDQEGDEYYGCREDEPCEIPEEYEGSGQKFFFNQEEPS